MNKNPKKTLHVFQTSRAAQNFLLKNQNSLLHVCSLSEFMEKSVLCKDRAMASDCARVALLKKAASKVAVEKLGFAKGFLDFLSHSDFLFSFFEELRAEHKSIDDIRGEDVYASFEDHLSVLEELFENYKKELDGHGLYDFISMDNPIINNSYISNFDEIIVESMGLFTAFELSILISVAQRTPTTLYFTVDDYNKKMTDKFAAFGIDAKEQTGKLQIDLTQKRLISCVNIDGQKINAKAFRLKNRAYEAAFALSRVAEYVRDGYEPEKIAIILADEGYAQMLRLFDRHGNLNFAFGESVSNTKMYSALDILLRHVGGENLLLQIESVGLKPLLEYFWPLGESGGVEPFLVAMNNFLSFKNFSDKESQTVKEIISKGLYEFGKESFVYTDLRSIEVGRIFLSYTGQKKIDDVGGGRIKVIGALESRGVELDAVVALDMNEEFFPKKIDKDLFLNTKIKERCKIPTSLDRQNLQKHFFYEMMRGVKECSFAFVENDEAAASPFLFEIGAEFVDVDEESLESLYFEKKEFLPEEPLVFDNSQNLYRQYQIAKNREFVSVSAFCDFLACDKFFYLKHVLGLQKEEFGQKEEIVQEIGSALHKAFEVAFDPKNGYVFESSERLADFVKNEALKFAPHLDGNFDFLFSLRQLGKFCEEEVKRESSNRKVYGVEMEIRGEIDGVAFDGRIDRIDETDGKYLLIDYKTSRSQIKSESEKSAANSRKYQLALYVSLLLQKGFEVEGAYYYDVFRGALVAEGALDAKLALLLSHIKRFLSPPSFSGASEKKNCRFCDFATICGVSEDIDAAEEEE